ncbi:MAG: formylglycine-generating enzyme family protein [Prevotellaceae bacterium]|jgi:formylglycine-generating enzyme required for sulfatase activity|nr:formylglycine-generating enzyme family protein [Prevotellaceae bacterium]
MASTRQILILLLTFLYVGAACGQKKKVAMLEPTIKSGEVTLLQKEIIRGALEEAIISTPGYEAITRTSLDAINNELTFQQSGMVDDDQRKRIGMMSGADLICVIQLTAEDNDLYVSCSLIEIESGKIIRTANELIHGTSGAAIQKSCKYLAEKLTSAASAAVSLDPSVPEMVQVAGGKFMMGCTSEQGNVCEEDEVPVRQITVSSFQISRTEITHEQYVRFLNESNIRTTEAYSDGKLIDVNAHVENTDGKWSVVVGYESYPMIYVSWYGASAYCSWAGGRLPTEAEWEYAARGGSKSAGRKYAGSNIISDVAWFAGSSDNHIHPVAQKKPNELGLFDMSGNVWEWCADWYISNSYAVELPADLTGTIRVLRGGSWNDEANNCRTTYRFNNVPESSYGNLGFRLVVPAPSEE